MRTNKAYPAISNFRALAVAGFVGLSACNTVVEPTPEPGGGKGSSSVVDTSTGDAVAANLLAGKKAFVNGSLVIGSSPDQGSLNLNTTPIPASPSGFYSSLTLTLSTSSVCSGTSIFGSAGTAICDSIFSDLTASNMNRNPATPQMTLSTEKNTSSYAAGYREVPNILTDDDGYHAPLNGCLGGSDICTSVVYATRPSLDCGTSGTIAARITNCVTVNGGAATWDGSTRSTNGEGVWKLVTRKNGAEVWRDERTKLLWSDDDDVAFYNWCQASGNKQSDDPSGVCTDPSNQDQLSPFSACAEFAGAQSPIPGEDYNAGTYSDFKGGMGALSTAAVRWRLPVRNDYLQAEIDGIRFVLPNMQNSFWSATVESPIRSYAWLYNGGLGYATDDDRMTGHTVRCVGR